MIAARARLLAISLVLTGCVDSAAVDDAGSPGTLQSPSVGIPPRPLSPEAGTMSGLVPRPGTRDGGAVDATTDALAPRPMREDEAPPPDVLRDTLRGQEAVGISLEAQLTWPGLPAPPLGTEVSKPAIAAARDATTLDVIVHLSPLGRMRIILTGKAFPLPAGTEIRARDDRYGTILVWPDASRYRVLPHGTLRALLAERRTDTIPLAAGTIRSEKPGNLFGIETTRVEVTSQLGTLTLEQAPVLVAGSGAPLLCRLLVELIGVDPTCAACSDTLTPVRAEYQWPEGGRLAFVVTNLLRGQQLRVDDLLVPPEKASFDQDALPPQPPPVLLSREDLLALRSRATETSTAPDAGAPPAGVLAVNRGDRYSYLLLDAVPLVRLAPGAEHLVVDLRAGRYVAAWRDLLGVSVQPPRVVEIPARIVVGEVTDGGTPSP